MCNSPLPEHFDVEIDINDDSYTPYNVISTDSPPFETLLPSNIGNPNIILSELRKNNVGGLIIGHLNINSLRNKFEALKFLIQGKVDIFVVSETKIDESFPINQFLIDGFATPFRLDRKNGAGGTIIYIRDDIPCKELKNHNLPNNIEGLFIELTLRKKKWILFGGYNTKKN